MMEHFRNFVFSALPGPKWFGHCTIYMLDNGDTLKKPGMFMNEGTGRHTEELMLMELSAKLPFFKGKSLRLVVYQNCSPCRSCSDKYAVFVRRARRVHGINLDMTLVFVAIYKIQRPSRQRNPILSWEEHEHNLEGLRKLRGLGVTLRIFESNDWRKLSRLLNVPKEGSRVGHSWSEIGQNCSVLAQDLDELLGTAMYRRNSPASSWNSGQGAEEFNLFWNSGLHDTSVRKGAYCVYRCHGCSVSGPYFNYGKKHHAEHELLDALDKHSMAHHSGCEVTVFQNLSPCGDCCSRYLSFLRKSEENQRPVQLTIVFASFYNIRRRYSNNNFSVPENYHDKNYRGLMSLKREGVRLRCFTQSDWMKLSSIMEVPPESQEDYTQSGRQREDEMMKLDMSLLGLADDDQDNGRPRRYPQEEEQVQITVKDAMLTFGNDLLRHIKDEVCQAAAEAVKDAVRIEVLAAVQPRQLHATVKEAMLALGSGIKDELCQVAAEAVKSTVGMEVRAAVQPTVQQALKRMLPMEVRAAVVPELQSTVASSIQEAVSSQLGREVPHAIRAAFPGLQDRVTTAVTVTEGTCTRVEASLKKTETRLSKINQRLLKTEEQIVRMDHKIEHLTSMALPVTFLILVAVHLPGAVAVALLGLLLAFVY